MQVRSNFSAKIYLFYCLELYLEREIVADRSTVPKGWNIVRLASADYPISFSIHLKQKNLERLDQLFQEISTPGTSQYRNFLNKAQVDDLVRPDPEVFDLFNSWLSSFPGFGGNILIDKF